MLQFDFQWYSRFGHCLSIEITAKQATSRLFRGDTVIMEEIFKPEPALLSAFLTDMDNAGLFDWEDHYNECCFLDGATWSVKLNTETGCKISRGTNGYPPSWPLFLAALEKVAGKVLQNAKNHLLHG